VICWTELRIVRTLGTPVKWRTCLAWPKPAIKKRLASVPPDQRSAVIFEPQDFDPDWERDRNAPANLAKLFEDLVGREDIVGDYQKISRTMKASCVDMRKQIATSFLFKGPSD
jgi:hypothetical protein